MTADEQTKVLASIRQSIRELQRFARAVLHRIDAWSSVLLATANKAPDPDFTEEEEKTLAAVRKPQKQEGSRWKDSTSC